MIFPREVAQVGECIALCRRNGGAPITHVRPHVMIGGVNWLASRLSYSLNCQPIPKGPPSLQEGLVLHSCDNEWCINPAHLRLGTQAENVKEAWERNSAFRQSMSVSRTGKKLKWQEAKLAARREQMKGNSLAAGRKTSEEQREALRQRALGNQNRKGKRFGPNGPHSPERIENMRRAALASHARKRAEKAAQAANA